MLKLFPFTMLISIIAANSSAAQDFVPNYDENKIPAFTLPDPLVDLAGRPVDNAAKWTGHRRAEILELFRQQVFGRSPAPIAVESKLIHRVEDALNGRAIRREIDLVLTNKNQSITISLLIYTPRNRPRAPVFLGLNFDGNHTIESDPRIRLARGWVPERKAGLTDFNAAAEEGRGSAAESWPVEMIVDRGFGLATCYCGDIDPDFDDGFQNGIHALFLEERAKIPAGEADGTIAAWAYGLSRVLDYLETDPLVDSSRVAVIGHSRLGKTALWAGASDQRFKLTISNNSGCGGAALSRRAFGETVGRINGAFPHWFCMNFRQYNQQESQLPVDQHQLLALIAPRALYVASASKDLWADPRGEFLSCVHADPVYRLLGSTGLGDSAPPTALPAENTPIHLGDIGYHLRTGDHALTVNDWKHYLSFADTRL